MTNTIKVSVTASEGWKLITTGTAGVFTVSSSSRYWSGVDTPAATDIGHRAENGDTPKFALDSLESLWVKADNSTTVSISFTGEGFFASWFKKMTRALRAVVVQPYIETNCKLGNQWGFSFYEPILPKTPDAGSTRYLLFKTGTKPVSLKSRTYTFDGLGVDVQVYRSPSLLQPIENYTDLTPLVYNFNDRNPQTLLSQIYTLATTEVSNLGSVWVPTRTFIGDPAQGTNKHTVINPDLTGLELWFAENTTYLIITRSIDNTVSQRLSQFGTFYEGFPDLP